MKGFVAALGGGLAFVAVGAEGPGLSAGEAAPAAGGGPMIWRVDNLDTIGGRKVAVLGAPRVAETGGVKVVEFDGTRDGLILDASPLEGWKAFTIEVRFRPDAGGLPEQRFVHCQENAGEDRAMIETRLAGDQWYLDTYVQSRGKRLALADRNAAHPVGAWYSAALVCDGTNMTHYVNGVKECSGRMPYAAQGAGRTSLGVRLNQVCWFRGAIRELRFTPQALPAAELLRP